MSRNIGGTLKACRPLTKPLPSIQSPAITQPTNCKPIFERRQNRGDSRYSREVKCMRTPNCAPASTTPSSEYQRTFRVMDANLTAPSAPVMDANANTNGTMKIENVWLRSPTVFALSYTAGRPKRGMLSEQSKRNTKNYGKRRRSSSPMLRPAPSIRWTRFQLMSCGSSRLNSLVSHFICPGVSVRMLTCFRNHGISASQPRCSAPCLLLTGV